MGMTAYPEYGNSAIISSNLDGLHLVSDNHSIKDSGIGHFQSEQKRTNHQDKNSERHHPFIISHRKHPPFFSSIP
jgi:hypothetical protein